MGVNQVGVDTTPPQPIVIRNISRLTTNASTTNISMTNTGTFVPKGVYNVNTILEGIGYGGSVTGSQPTTIETDTSTPLIVTLNSFEADTGRPGPTFISGGLFKDTLVLYKDSYVQTSINVMASLAGVPVSIVLTPKKDNIVALPTFTGNRTTTATTTSTSGSASDIGFGGAILGWDYDNDAPMVISLTFNPTTTPTNTPRLKVLDSSWWLFRYNRSTGKWTRKQWSNFSAAAGHTWVGNSGFFFQDTDVRIAQFFIKNNFLHNLNYQGVLDVDANSTRWGWIKADLTAAGNTLTVQPGLTNTAFAETSSNMGTGSNNRMIYYWDRVSHKVIYNGSRSSTSNSSWGNTFGWRHKWGQWDIRTETIEHQVDNGTVDPRIAGGTTEANMAWANATPNAAEGISYAVGDNSGTAYNAKWSRAGVYTGVGNYEVYNAMSSTTTSGFTVNSVGNSADFYPFNHMTWQTSNNLLTRDYNTPNSGSAALYQATYGSRISDRSGMFSGNFGVGNGPYQASLVTGEWIVQLIGGYQKVTGNASRYTFPLTVYMLPVTETNVGRALQPLGGLRSYRLETPNSGINNGTW